MNVATRRKRILFAVRLALERKPFRLSPLPSSIRTPKHHCKCQRTQRSLWARDTILFELKHEIDINTIYTAVVIVLILKSNLLFRTKCVGVQVF
jgi:hypothetical protein